MSVSVEEVVALYRDQRLTMQEVADRVGVTKSRVHQILREQGVKTAHAYRPKPQQQETPRPGKTYRAYQMTPETRVLVDRLAETLGMTKTAVVTRAVEELADRHLPGGRADTGKRPKKRRGQA